MRAIDCDCGQHFEAETDAQLAPLIKEHVTTAHPEMKMTPEQEREEYMKRVRDI